MTTHIRSRSLHDHGSSSGDGIRWSYQIRTFDHAGKMNLEICVHIHVSNALSVTGHINDQEKALSILDHAADNVRAYHQRKGGMVVPGKDVALPGLDAARLEVYGPIENREYTIAVFANAKDAINDMHARRKIAPPTVGGTTVLL